MKKIIYILVVLSSLSCFTQETETVLENRDKNHQKLTFSSIEEALNQPLNVYRLYLTGNKLKSLPESIGKFKNLRILELDNNELTELPKSIEKLTNLVTLA